MNSTLPPKLQKHYAVAVDRADNDLAVVRPGTLAILPKLLVRFGVKPRQPVLAGHLVTGEVNKLLVAAKPVKIGGIIGCVVKEDRPAVASAMT